MGNSGAKDEADAGRLLSVIPDSNVLIHGKALPDLPWAELGRSTVEVLFVPQVIRELDKLKTQTGRPNKLARQLSRDVRTLTGKPDMRMEIRKSKPQLSKRVELRRADESLHGALKLDHADQALINYALQLRLDGLDVLLLTDDTICGTTASEVGLPFMYLPDHWQREPEPDDDAKEIERLRKEIKRMATTEPQVFLAFRDVDGAEVARLEGTVTDWPALAELDIEALVAEAGRLCPPATSFERPAPSPAAPAPDKDGSNRVRIAALLPRTVHQPATAEEIERYKSITYPAWLERVRQALRDLPESLNAVTKWPSVIAVAENRGTRSAIEALLTVESKGPFTMMDVDTNRPDDDGLRDDAVQSISMPPPPSPPRGRTTTIDPFGRPDDMARGRMPSTPLWQNLDIPKSRERDVFYWKEGKTGWVPLMQLECASWRHGEEEVAFVLELRPDAAADCGGAIEISLKATNLSGRPVARLPVRIGSKPGDTLLEARRLIRNLGPAASGAGG